MADAYICDFVRTPIGRYAGALKDVRTDDLGAHPMRVLRERNASVDWDQLDDVIYGCANQAGEDNRNVARMALLLAGLPSRIPGATINRLCGSGLDAVGTAARAIRAGDASLMIAGGVESMTRAPFVMGKATEAFARSAEIYDTTIGWRFVNPLMKDQYGVDAMPETAENVAEDFQITRPDQDAFAYRSQMRAKAAQDSGFFAREIAPVEIAGRKGTVTVDRDEHPARRHHAGSPRQTQGAVPQARRHGHRRQCLRRERRRRRPDHRLRGSRQAPRPDAARPRRGDGDRRRRPAHHGHRPGPGHPETAGAPRPEDRRHRRDRAERGVRRARPGRDPPTRPAGRCRTREPARRRDRPRPSARHVRRASGADRA